MKRLRLAIVGFGRLGRACADAALHAHDLELVGAVLRQAFEMLIPEGRTEVRDRPGASLHHTEAARLVPGVADALATEARDASGALRRYVYVELAKGAAIDPVREAFARDPFPVESVESLEHAARGVVLERLGTARGGAHQNLLFEARFDVATFAARVMLDAARRLASLRPGAHRYSLCP
ncbi:MAG: hypothetical protein ABS56_13955 [Lautropia sp. SCN 69-89]|nr:MAG: hypothetical protein ABS56_13955 [Lautropia sp. SCN 69-89]